MEFNDYCKRYKNKYVRIYLNDDVIHGDVKKVKSTSLILKVKKDFYLSLPYRSITYIQELEKEVLQEVEIK